MRLSEYLKTIGLESPLPPTLDTLRRLHVAHLRTFLFENLEIQRHGSVRTDVESIERKFLGGAGGYCFEQNTLFAAVLREIGFRVDTILGRVGPPGNRFLNHLLLRVEIDGRPWLADVGFGAEGILEPIPIVDGARDVQAGISYALRREGHHWMLTMQCGDITWEMYEFGDAPHTPADIALANYYTSTHPESAFRRKLTIQRVTAEERLILRPTVITRYRDGVRTDIPIDRSQVRAKARELFGIDLGDGPLVFESYSDS